MIIQTEQLLALGVPQFAALLPDRPVYDPAQPDPTRLDHPPLGQPTTTMPLKIINPCDL